MHESMKRLLDYARSAPGPTGKAVRGFADIGAAMGVSSAVLSNWKARGLSKDGALKAEAAFGCSAQWLLSGVGTAMVVTPLATGQPPPVPVGRRVFSAAAQRQFMDDLGDLLPEEADALIQDLHARAEKMRRHRDYILQLSKPTAGTTPEKTPRQRAKSR